MDESKLIKKMAQRFEKPGCGFIHSEMWDGKVVETTLDGELLAIMWQICLIIDRLAKKCDSTFGELACQIIAMPVHGGYSTIASADEELDWWDVLAKKVDAERTPTEPAAETILKKDHERDVAMLRSKLTEAEMRLETQGEVHKAQVKAKNATIKALNKEILRLEHELKDMEDRHQFGEKIGLYES